MRDWRRNRCDLLLMAAMLMLATACTSSDETALDEGGASMPATIGFDAYLQRQTSRSGATGTLTLEGTGSTTSLQAKGFGVLAYSTGHEYYSQLAIPDFMYNDHVTYVTDKWTYAPTKFWPNGEGEANGVTGALPSYVSFFAYAPWVKVEEATGLVASGGDGDEYSETKGITALTRNVKTGDPMVFYNVSFNPQERVDLCWATPMLNQTKPTAPATDNASKVNMEFRHALAAVNIQIDANISGTMNPGHTRIWVRSITLQGITNKGLLNLNNASTTPLWLQLDGISSIGTKPVTVLDGRSDFYEGAMADANEMITGLNPALVQSQPYTITAGVITAPEAAGVTTTTVNLFGDDSDGDNKAEPVYVIPTNTPLRINIVYDVETYDPKLVTEWLADGQTHGSRIRNNISADVTSISRFEAGKQYQINLHLGMKSVEVDASVTAWGTHQNADINLPN